MGGKESRRKRIFSQQIENERRQEKGRSGEKRERKRRRVATRAPTEIKASQIAGGASSK